MKRAIVTGARGFMGRHAVSALVARGYEVHALTSSQSLPGAAGGVVWHRADLMEPESLFGLFEELRPGHLLHLAWTTRPPEFWTSTQNVRWVEATLALVRAFTAAGGRRFVGAGSCAEYDWRYGLCVERLTPLAPRELYGACKAATWEVIEALGRVTGLSAAWGRVFHVFGPGEHPSRVVASVARALVGGEPALCSSGKQVRDYMFVVDAGEAFAALLDGDVEGPINVGSGVGLPLGDLLTRLARRVGRVDLLRIGALPDRPNEPGWLVADVTRLREEVKFQARCDIDAAVDATIDWWMGERACNR